MDRATSARYTACGRQRYLPFPVDAACEAAGELSKPAARQLIGSWTNCQADALLWRALLLMLWIIDAVDGAPPGT
jgi:hypothetical protein